MIFLGYLSNSIALVPITSNRWQAIIRTDYGPFRWRYMGSLVHNVLSLEQMIRIIAELDS